MARAGVFHFEQAPLVSNDDSKKKDVVLDVTTTDNGNSKDSLFFMAWRDDALT